MASIKKLKKDINYLTFELLSECFTLRSIHSGIEENKFEEVIRKLVAKRNELIHKVLHPEKKDTQSLSRYYNKVRMDMLELVGIVEELTT